MSHGSMKGSGIDSVNHTAEMVCAERCNECSEQNKTCDAVWEEDFNTDDYGSVEADVTCEKCKHTFTYTYQQEDGEDPDYYYEMMNDK